jgi:hypothetical protein
MFHINIALTWKKDELRVSSQENPPGEHSFIHQNVRPNQN